MRFWATRDTNGAPAFWTGPKPKRRKGERCWVVSSGTEYLGSGGPLLKATFPVGIRKGQCREIKLNRATVKEE